jgi:hypothetical protein
MAKLIEFNLLAPYNRGAALIGTFPTGKKSL